MPEDAFQSVCRHSDSCALAGAAFNGFISGILALGFLTPLELLLNTASVFRLMDLSDLNNPTMRRLMLSASGTYTHSLMVAQLAAKREAIKSNAIGISRTCFFIMIPP